MTTIKLYPGDNIASMRSMKENSVDGIVTDPPYLLSSIADRYGNKAAKPPSTTNNDGSFSRLSGGFMGCKWDAPNIEVPMIDGEFGHYMAGLIDGEGCFSVHKKTVNGCETYDCQFSMTLRADDGDILHEIQRRLGGIGSLAHRPGRDGANPQVRLCISSKADCQILRAVLTAFPLRAKKVRDFEIWCHALDAWVNHEPKSSWDDVAFYRDQLMLVRGFGSLYKPEILFHYRWSREAFRVLKPGAYIFAFSGSRTGHWQAVAMEMAGFIMHPMHGWAFGSGFPKAHAADKAIDKMLGVKRPVNGYADVGPDMTSDNYGRNEGKRRIAAITSPGSPEAAQWEGWAYGTQTQKPALEPIYLGQKPFSEKTGAANLLKHGVGAVNIDGCRVPSSGGMHRTGEPSQHRRYFESGATNFAMKPGPRGGDPKGRHPANLILDGSPEVVAMFPDSKGQQGALRGTEPSRTGDENTNCYGKYGPRPATPVRGDSGSAARFFHQFPLDTDPLIYHPKAGKNDRAGSRHPTVKPVALLQYLIRHITPQGGVILDPFAGSGTTAEAARREGFDCILMEAEPEYVEFIHGRFNLGDTGQKGASTLEIGINSPNMEQVKNEEGVDREQFDLGDLLGGNADEEPSRNYESVRSVAGADLEDLLA